MAEYGKIVMKKLSGGVLNVTATDGATSTDLVLPLSGTVLAADINGNVGIGTDNPVSLVDIRNTRTTGTFSDNAILQLKSSNRNCAYVMDTIGGSYSGSINNYVSGVTKSQLLFDSTGNILSTFPNGALGYGTGSGGTVTQATSKETSVTLNKPTGTITMSNATLAPNVKVSFLFNNSLISSADTLLVSVISGSTVLTQYEARARCAIGIASIVLSHTYPTSLSDAVVIKFDIIKGATA